MKIYKTLCQCVLAATQRLRIDCFIPDKLYLDLLFGWRIGHRLNWNNPRTYNEKLQWLKIYNRQPQYTDMVDKYKVKQFVTSKLGDDHVARLLGVWDSPDNIEWDGLPDRFVLKCSHDSGGIVICKDKNTFNKKAAVEKLEANFKKNFFYGGREWPYKDVERRVFAEQYLEDENGQLNDYKVFCFNGEPRIIQVDYDRFKAHRRTLFTPEWERIDATFCYPTDFNREIPKPRVLEQLLDMSRKLSFGIPHVRTDFYIVKGKVYFGEMTFFPESGTGIIIPEELDIQMGSWIKFPAKPR